MPTNLENRERQRQRKRESKAKGQRSLSRKRAKARDKKAKETFFVGGTTWNFVAAVRKWEMLAATRVKMSGSEKKWRTRNLASAPDIERAHRVGKSSRRPASAQNSASRPRTIVCRLRDWKEGETILKCARRIKPDNIFLKEDLSPATLEKRESQRAKMEAAKRAGKIAYFVLDKLVIRDRPNVENS